MMRILATLLVGLVALPASAAPVVDGSKDAIYGPALAVQLTETSFGDNFSELDAAYGRIEGGRLYLMLTGNLEANFNKLNIFIDSVAGGQGTFSAVTGNDGSDSMNGLVFDAEFTADYHVIARRGVDGFNGWSNGKFDVNYADLAANEYAFHQDVFSSPDNQVPGAGLEGADPTDGGPGQGGTLVHGAIEIGYNDSNDAGVVGCADGGSNCGNAVEALALDVNTGFEMSIALADIGITSIAVGDEIRVSAIVTSGDHSFASNQVLGSAPGGTVHLAGLGGVDYSLMDGDQFFTITAIPEPTSLLLVLMGLVGLAGCRRR